jgi:hypothetical protein
MANDEACLLPFFAVDRIHAAPAPAVRGHADVRDAIDRPVIVCPLMVEDVARDAARDRLCQRRACGSANDPRVALARLANRCDVPALRPLALVWMYLEALHPAVAGLDVRERRFDAHGANAA